MLRTKVKVELMQSTKFGLQDIISERLKQLKILESVLIEMNENKRSSSMQATIEELEEVAEMLGLDINN